MTDDDGVERRDLLRGVAGLGGFGLTALAATAELPTADAEEIEAAMARTDPHTEATFAAVVDAVVPRTPDLAGEDGEPLGPEHEPGGLEAGVHEYFITYVNTLFEGGLPGVGYVSNVRLSEAVAAVLDEGAAELLARGANEHPPGRYAPEGYDWTAGGPFARLHPEDRVRALALFDEEEKGFETSALPGPVAESDASIVGQLVVAFPEVIYYSEWQGYDDITDPPSERSFDLDAVQSWTQTGFPGYRDGYAAHRGYVSGGALGGGGVWRRVRGDDWTLELRAESGRFRDNDDYDTGDYEEVVSGPGDGRGGARPPEADATVDADADVDAGEDGTADADVDATVDADAGRSGDEDEDDDGDSLSGGARHFTRGGGA